MADRDLLDPRIKDNYKQHRRKIRGRVMAMICPTHGFIRGEFCPQCRNDVVSSFNIKDERWVEGWYDNIASEPVYIRDRKELIDTCERHGVMARAFMKPKSSARGWEHRKTH